MGLFSLLADILFVGHSLVGPDLPPMLESALRQMNEPSSVQAQIINGASLAYNWDHAAKAEGVDGRARLASSADVLILTEAQPIADQIKGSDTAANIARFTDLAAKTNPEARVFLYETWPVLGDDVTAWQAAIAADLPLWETAAAQGAATAAHPVALIPAGQAFSLLAEEIAAGRVPDLTSAQQLFKDGQHPNGRGWYFVTMVQVAAITGRSPEGLPPKLTRTWASRDAIISGPQAQAMQRIAWQAVSSYAPAKQTATAVPMPAAPTAPLPAFAPIVNPNLSLGLAGINDWSVQQPFLDVMKTARPWIGHLPGQFGGWEMADLERVGAVGPHGWPVAIPPEVTSLSTLILTDLPADAGGVAGRYVLTYQGKGDLKLEGRAQVVQAEAGRILFDYTPGDGFVAITLTRLDVADPIHAISVVRAEREAELAAGKIFNPDWLARIRGVKGIRFMDWMATNNSPLSETADRPMPDDFTYGRNGVPVEVMVALANELQADPWFTLPHLATNDLVRTYAQITHESLDPALKAHVEFSNEVWNWQFAQAKWAEEQGRARWGQDQKWVQFYALRAAQVMDIWSQVFADAPDRLLRIIATQTGWLGLEDQILNAPLVIAEGAPAPASHFDAYAVTGYFSALLGADEKAGMVRDWIAQSKASDPANPYALANQLAAQELRDGSISGDPSDSLGDLLGKTLPYQAKVAEQNGLKLVMYEGGTHVVGFGGQVADPDLTAFFTQLNFSPEMGALYAELLAGWAALSDAPFNAFVDVYRPSKWGSWGALRHLGDDNPRWQALAKGCTGC
jgi:hypothetical protein